MRIRWYGAAAAAILCIVTIRGVAGQEGRAAGPAASLQLVDDLVVGNRILANEGVLDGLGHISVRHRTDRFLLARDLAPGLVTAADVVEYDLEGSPTSAQAPQGVSERFIHAAIYKARADVMSIVHAHTPSVLAYAVSNIPLRPVYHMSTFLIGGVPMFDIRKVPGATGMLVNNVQLGTALAQTLGDKTVALMRGHGYVVVGPTIPETVSRGIFLDVNARVQTQAMGLGGTVVFMGPQDAGPLGGQTAQPGAPPVYPRSWWFWKERAMGR